MVLSLVQHNLFVFSDTLFCSTNYKCSLQAFNIVVLHKDTMIECSHKAMALACTDLHITPKLKLHSTTLQLV